MCLRHALPFIPLRFTINSVLIKSNPLFVLTIVMPPILWKHKTKVLTSHPPYLSLFITSPNIYAFEKVDLRFGVVRTQGFDERAGVPPGT